MEFRVRVGTETRTGGKKGRGLTRNEDERVKEKTKGRMAIRIKDENEQENENEEADEDDIRLVMEERATSPLIGIFESVVEKLKGGNESQVQMPDTRYVCTTTRYSP